MQNPQASDSLEGVARWRLQQERIRQQVTDAGVALEWLVERGFLQRISSPMSEPIYRLNESRRLEGQRFVQEHAGEAREPRSKR